MDKLIPAFKKSLFDSTLSESCIDMAELGIDSLLDDGIFKNIPIFNLLIGLGKTAQNIYDRNLLKQTINFINSFNDKLINPKKLEKYKKRLIENPKYAEEELGRILILLNSFIDFKKSKILARFYRAYVEENINWDTFCELSDITSRLFIADIPLLLDIFESKVTETTQCKPYQAERLIALGLLDFANKGHMFGADKPILMPKIIGVNKLGEIFVSLSY